jgi:hypothetical protein
MSTTAHTAAYSAVALSILSLFLCALFVPNIWLKIREITEDLERDMDTFKVMQSDIWIEFNAKHGYQRLRRSSSRNTRQEPGAAGQCSMFSIFCRNNNNFTTKIVETITIVHQDRQDRQDPTAKTVNI